MYKISLILVLLSFLGCQNNDILSETSSNNFILSSDNGILDLSEFELEQQKIDKFLADEAMNLARENRTISSVQNLKDISFSKINIAIFARNSKNKKGEKLYNRLKKTSGNDNCKNFPNLDQAQRFFLIKGGPKNDFWFLDPDGDGFACDWNPNFYRKIKINY